ncbi:MAG: hypothetical protein WBP46_16500 [Thiolinea sp.]
MTDSDKVHTNGSSHGRGISYPFVNLETAIEKAKIFYAQERKSAVPVVSAMKHFGYSEKSGSGRQMISALLQFGLIKDEGMKSNRHVKLTDRAFQILLDEPNSSARLNAIRDAARSPKIYSELLTKWGEELPSDHTISYYLQRDKDFNPKTLQSFINDFRSSIAFAKLNSLGAQPSDLPRKLQPGSSNIKASDCVQSDTNSSYQLNEPTQEGGFEIGQAYATSNTSEMSISPISINSSTQYAIPSIKQIAGTRQDVFSLDEGSVVLQWPEKMSQESYEDFEAWIQIQLRKIKRSIS